MQGQDININLNARGNNSNMQNNNQMTLEQALGHMNNRINNLTTKVDGVLNLMIE